MRGLEKLSAIVALVFACITIFFTYDHIQVFLMAGAVLVLAELVAWHRLTRELSKFRKKLDKVLPLALILVGSIGISAAVTLTREKVALLLEPGHVTSCSINPIVACGPVINSEQASAFGIPNPLLGIFGFGALIIAGMSILAGGKFARWWWISLWAGTLLGLLFSFWLVYQSLYVIGALCIYCMVVWSITIPIFYYTTLYNVLHSHFRLSKANTRLFEQNHLFLPILTYVIIIGLIYIQFRDYWNTLI